ncbi:MULTISPECIES: cation-translocating P-type ATPase [Enterococcus]|uniref:cation-translocating P-type ATPase n=1 Tax=Enterococcus TaxID=1350 RepID=UPI0010F8B5D4|nr:MULTISPECIES: cation-translocating P-type ATPase [Enterococcus]KAF1301194.1 ATPase [Enterococcus sp. JM9B]
MKQETTDYQKKMTDLYHELDSNENGLSSDAVEQRLAAHGFNELQSKAKTPLWKVFLETFKDAMVIVLLIVAVVQIVMGHPLESVVIFAVLLLNSVVSVIQTKKAENSLDALKKLSSPSAKVLRNGAPETVPAREIVPGDVVLLDAGDFVPADGRLIEAGSLRIDEGMLTGESVPAEKNTAEIKGILPVGDRNNMVHSGTLVVYGRGKFLVSRTGKETEIGQVADLLENATTAATPLQRNLDRFSQKLGLAILALSLLIFGIQLARIFISGNPDIWPSVMNAFMFAVAVAVAAIPEALQSIVTIVLSLGTKKMAKQHAIIRKLSAVETLGATSIICTDKTGTLTQNKMTVVDSFFLENHEETQQQLLQTALLANDAAINEEGNKIGDPTEIALVDFGSEKQISAESLRKKYPRENELPFDSDRKLMSTVHTIDGKLQLLTKGAPDVIFQRSTHVKIGNKILPFDAKQLEKFQKQNEEFSNRALRVLAFAYRPVQTTDVTHEDENQLILLGLLAMIDPPREEVYQAITDAKNAGIKPIMITGDHKTTARAIAQEIGLFSKGDLALTGAELDQLTHDELMETLEKVTVYARVSPENKIRIVKAWQEKGHISAMTGDGVNDAPALKQADIGIAMGTGTDVAKDASAMVLTDDNFASIVNAIGVGRNVFDNIKKAVAYLFAGNLGAIITIIFALVMNWANPFTALQLLFINLVNDSVPAIALGMEKPEPNIMQRQPRNPRTGIFSGSTFISVAYRGILISIAVIVAQWIGMQQSAELGVAMSFSTLILSRTLQIFPARSNTQTVIGAGFFHNKIVLAAVGFCGLLYAGTLLPALRGLFSIPADFGQTQFFISLCLALAAVILMELTKVLLSVIQTNGKFLFSKKAPSFSDSSAK